VGGRSKETISGLFFTQGQSTSGNFALLNSGRPPDQPGTNWQMEPGSCSSAVGTGGTRAVIKGDNRQVVRGRTMRKLRNSSWEAGDSSLHYISGRG